MPWKTSEPEWVPEEYPKMLTKKDDDGRHVPEVYPKNHPKQGLPIIFENADDEAAYLRPPKRDKKDK